MKRNTKIIIGIVVVAAIVGGVGLTVLLPKTPDIQVGDWWEYSSGKRDEVVGEEMVGEHDCWKVKVYLSEKEYEDVNLLVYDYVDKENLGTWKKDFMSYVRNSDFEMEGKYTAIYQPEPLCIK